MADDRRLRGPLAGLGSPAAVIIGVARAVLRRRTRRDAARRKRSSFALHFGPAPVEVTTDRAPVYPRLVENLEPAARHVTEQYANNRVEADHGQLKSRLRPMAD